MGSEGECVLCAGCVVLCCACCALSAPTPTLLCTAFLLYHPEAIVRSSLCGSYYPPEIRNARLNMWKRYERLPICEATIYRRYCLLSARHFFVSLPCVVFPPWSHFSFVVFSCL